VDQYQKRLTWKYAQNAQRKTSHGDEALTIAVSIQGSTLWVVTYVERPSGTSLGNSQIEHEFLRKWATLKHGVYHMCFHIFSIKTLILGYTHFRQTHMWGPKKDIPRNYTRGRVATHMEASSFALHLLCSGLLSASQNIHLGAKSAFFTMTITHFSPITAINKNQ